MLAFCSGNDVQTPPPGRPSPVNHRHGSELHVPYVPYVVVCFLVQFLRNKLFIFTSLTPYNTQLYGSDLFTVMLYSILIAALEVRVVLKLH